MTEIETVELEGAKEDVVSLDVPAPGWKKKFIQKKGGTSKRKDIIFISPTGKEINDKKQLEKYLKEHPGGPAVPDFYWGIGEKPRRSSRFSGEKEKALPMPESEPPKKRGRKSSASNEDAKHSETASEGAEETKVPHMEMAEKFEKDNVEGETGKVAVKENENENKDKTQDADSKTESISQEVKHGEDTNMSTNVEEGKENAEAVSEKLEGPQDGVEVDASEAAQKENEGLEGATSQGKAEQSVAEAVSEMLEDPQDGVEVDASGAYQKENEGLEGATSQGKVEQPVAEAEEELGCGEQDKPEVGITEGRENEVEGEEEEENLDKCTTESEAAINEKESANYNEGQNTSEVNNKINNEVEEAVQSGINGSNTGEVKA